MGSIKKKLTKTLRKITPKEIAPILPFASMFIPGMQGLSPLLKFALPQLLTAAGSARTSGKISGLNQALAGIGSLAGINASNQALQAASTTPNVATVGSPGAMAAQSASATQAANQLAANQQGLSGILSSGASAIGNAPVIGGTFNTLGQGMTNLSSLFPGGAPAQFGFNMLAPASLGASMSAVDQANLDKLEAEAEAAKQAGDIQAYQEAMQAVAAATARFSDPYNRYGNNPGEQFNPFTGALFAAEGGRVGRMFGGGADMGAGDTTGVGGMTPGRGPGGGMVAGAAVGPDGNAIGGTGAGFGAGIGGGDGGSGGDGGGGGQDTTNQNQNAAEEQGPPPATFNPIVDMQSFYGPFGEDTDVNANGIPDSQEFGAAPLGQAPNEMGITTDLGVLGSGLGVNLGPGTIGFGDEMGLGFGTAFGGEDQGTFGIGIGPTGDLGMQATYGFDKGGRVGAMSGLFIDPPMDADGREIVRNPNEMGVGSMIREALGNLIRGAKFDDQGYLFPRQPNDLRKRIYDTLGFDPSNYPGFDDLTEYYAISKNKGGRIGAAMGAMGQSMMYPMNPAPSQVAPNMPPGMQVDGRNGTFIPMGAQEKKDDVPAMLAKNEFVMTSDAVKGMGNGDVNVGAQRMYDLMNQLESKV